jgi:hypothetical protein
MTPAGCSACLELEDLATTDLRGRVLKRAVAAVTDPQITVAIDVEAVERGEVGSVDQLGLGSDRTVWIDVVAPNAAVRCSLPLDDVKLLFIGREGESGPSAQRIPVATCSTVLEKTRCLAKLGSVKDAGIAAHSPAAPRTPSEAAPKYRCLRRAW